MLRRLIGAVAVTLCSCYASGGDGSSPPPNQFYFPVGLAVSQGGNALYAVNSDFDLQWNGGTLQSYDLHAIRGDVTTLLNWPATENEPPKLPYVKQPEVFCRVDGTIVRRGSGQVAPPLDADGRPVPRGLVCAPPIQSEFYVRSSATIGAFATDLQLSRDGTRLFMPMRSNASLTWADVVPDDPQTKPTPEGDAGRTTHVAFPLKCGSETDGRCDGQHRAGSNPDEPGNTRHITMPGESFGMAQSEDGTAIAITHQNITRTSLFSTGLSPWPRPAPGQPAVPDPCTGAPPRLDRPADPSLQFVVDGVTVGGNGIVAIPHDPDAFPGATDCPFRPAFLQTSRFQGRVDRLRYYQDDGREGPSNNYRPYLTVEASFPVSVNASGIDSRGIAIDNSERIACKDKATTPAAKQECARLPARVFIANRSPASILIGQVGGQQIDGAFNPDDFILYGNVPLSVGPSRLYLAPIVDAAGKYALRLFIVCFDSATIFVYDPEAQRIENTIRVGVGPFAMAFDPFNMEDVALHRPVPEDDRRVQPAERGLAGVPANYTDVRKLRRYSFAYVASFTHSYVQVIDLDNSPPQNPAGNPLNATFETIVYTLGQPTAPKGAR